MKTKFTINDEIFGDNPTLPAAYEYYEKFDYAKEGFILDKEREEVCIIVDKEIHLNVGDNVDIHDTIRKVVWKCFDVINDIIEYALEQE